MSTLIIFTILSTNLIINCFPVTGVSTINVGDQLNLTSQLVSPGRIFTLGFFTIPATNNTYLGIWYTNNQPSTKVWVANPSTPINISSSGILMIDPDTGILIITTAGTTLVNISDNESAHGPNLTATLEDTGNFQLKNKTDNRILWQSFDYPTNVLLPNMKLGSNLRTGKSWNLTSWLNEDIPDRGAFTLSWESEGENSQRLMIRRRGQPYWTSGDLINQTFKFMEVNSPTSEYQYNLSYVYNDEERSFSFHGINGVQHMWVLRPGGEIQEDGWLTVWTPEFCYGYDARNGCVAGSNLPHCRSEKDRFRRMNGVFARDINGWFDYNNIRITNSDCMLRCWDNCNCVGFVTINKGTGCGIWTGTKSTNNFSISPQGDGRLTYVLISPNPSKDITRIWAPIVVGSFLLLFCFGLWWYLRKRKLPREEERQKRDDEYFLQFMASDSFKDAANLESNDRKGSELIVFSFASIVAATDNFSSENKLGQGGFGPVYKVVNDFFLRNQREVYG